MNWVKITGRFLSILAVVMDFVPVEEGGKSEMTGDDEYQKDPHDKQDPGVAAIYEEIATIEKEIAQFKEQLLNNNIRMNDLQTQRDEEEKKINVIKDRCNARAARVEQPAVDEPEPETHEQATKAEGETTYEHDISIETIEPAEYSPVITSILKTTGFTSLKHVTFEGQGEALHEEPLQ